MASCPTWRGRPGQTPADPKTVKVMGAADPDGTGNIDPQMFATWADGGGLAEDLLQHALKTKQCGLHVGGGA